MQVTKQKFRKLFDAALESAIQNAEAFYGRTDIPREFQIELHLHGKHLLSVEDALDRLFIDEKASYKIIDISFKEIRDNATVVFVRASGHPPVPWDETYSSEEGFGPFKQMIS